MIDKCRFVLIFCFVFLVAAFAEQLSGTDGNVAVSVEMSSTQINMAGQISLEGRFEPITAKDAKLIISDDGFWLETLSEGDGWFKAALTPKASGEYELLLKFEYVDTAGEKVVFGIGKIAVEVLSTLSQQDLEHLEQGDYSPIISDIARIDEVKEPARNYWLIAAVAAIVAIIITAVAVILRKRNRCTVEQKSFVIVHNIAYELLDDLKFMLLPQKGEFKLYYTNLSNILRYYIEYRFNIAAPDMTTEEFLEKLRYSDTINFPAGSGIDNFFEISDMVKFAKFEPTCAQAEEAMASVKGFVSSTEDYLCVIEKRLAEKFSAVLEVCR